MHHVKPLIFMALIGVGGAVMVGLTGPFFAWLGRAVQRLSGNAQDTENGRYTVTARSTTSGAMTPSTSMSGAYLEATHHRYQRSQSHSSDELLGYLHYLRVPNDQNLRLMMDWLHLLAQAEDGDREHLMSWAHDLIRADELTTSAIEALQNAVVGRLESQQKDMLAMMTLSGILPREQFLQLDQLLRNYYPSASLPQYRRQAETAAAGY
jgi:hypothetical protein